jgi:RNA-directed DNA polymerase
VISPLLANVYLHEALDVWFVNVVRPRLLGRAHLIRYADDAVLVFSHERDARRVLDVLPLRMAKYGLKLHPDKTRLVDFRRPRPAAAPRARDDDAGPGSFDLLGFRHFWARSRKGWWVVKQKTAPSRFSRAVRATGDWCRRHRHLPWRVQHEALSQKLRGHCSYYGITGNSEALGRFAQALRRVWHKWLDRRSNRGGMTWERFNAKLRRHPLPQPHAIHSIYRRAAKP